MEDCYGLSVPHPPAVGACACVCVCVRVCVQLRIQPFAHDVIVSPQVIVAMLCA